MKFSLMDTNNFSNKIGVGERESWIFSDIVKKRNFNMGHGIGRSGDVNSIQPKAAGSSLILKLTVYLVSDCLKVMSYQHIKFDNICLLPLCTGMSLCLVFQVLK